MEVVGDKAETTKNGSAEESTTTNKANGKGAPENEQEPTDMELNEANKKLTSADYYANSYSHHGIHEEMLKDEVRTLGYRRAVGANSFLKDKIVLDVGCGTGILSMFAAQSGAKHVYAIDMSDILDRARQIVKVNGFEDVITLIKGKAEEVVLPVDKVDVIVSEWMGYFLLYESMLDTVLYCRDKWLKEGGLIYPDKAVMVLCGIEDAQYRAEKIDWWENVYGFDFSCIKKVAMLEPIVDIVESHMVVTDTCVFKALDIATVKKEDLSFTAPWRLVAARDDWVHALTVHFDVEFTHCRRPFGFSTGPNAEYTHWKQTVFYLETPIEMCVGDVLCGTMSVTPNDRNPRDLDIHISYQFKDLEWTQEYMLR